MRERYNETAGQPDLILNKVRRETDEAYYSMVKRIDALMEVAPDEMPDVAAGLETLIRRMNAIIGRANEILAARRGRGDNAGDTKPEE
jgi:hypothetical protein